MLVIEITLNIYWLGSILLVFAALGFYIGNRVTNSLRDKVDELEREILSSHAEILELQKERVQLSSLMKEPPIPVIPISTPKEEKKSDEVSDVNLRKQPLSKKSV